MKRTFVLWGLTAIVFLSGCQEDASSPTETENQEIIEVEWKSTEEQQIQLETFTYDDYRAIFDQAVTKAQDYEVEDETLNKWIIRALANDELLYETDLSDEEILLFAQQRMEENKVWKQFAQDEYGISINDEEVDEFIKAGPLKSLEPDSDILDDGYKMMNQAYADALGITMEELALEFERDVLERNVIWKKLGPKLADKYGTLNNASEKYRQEVQKELTK